MSGPGMVFLAVSGAVSVAIGTRGEIVTTHIFESLTSSATKRVKVLIASFVTT